MAFSRTHWNWGTHQQNGWGIFWHCTCHGLGPRTCHALGLKTRTQHTHCTVLETLYIIADTYYIVLRASDSKHVWLQCAEERLGIRAFESAVLGRSFGARAVVDPLPCRSADRGQVGQRTGSETWSCGDRPLEELRGHSMVLLCVGVKHGGKMDRLLALPPSALELERFDVSSNLRRESAL